MGKNTPKISPFRVLPASLLYISIFIVLGTSGCETFPEGWAVEANKGYDLNAKSLIEQGAQLNSVDHNHNNAFLWSVKKNYIELVKSLIMKHGYSVDEKNEVTGETALMIAIKSKNWDIVNFLLSHNANTATTDNTGKSALDWAVTSGNKELINKLIHANKNSVFEQIKVDPLVSAIYANNAQTIEMLIKKNPPINTRNSYGETPLIAAIKTRNSQLIDLLLVRGGDTRIADDEGVSPLMWAVQTGDSDIVNKILKTNVSIDSQSKQGHTALFFAAIRGKNDIVSMLLENGADIHRKDRNNNCVLYLTTYSGNYSTINVLLKSGADPTETEENTRETNPTVTAVMFDYSAKYALDNKQISLAIKYYRLAEEDYRRSAEKFNDLADAESSSRFWSSVGKSMLYVTAVIGSQVQADIQAKQYAQMNALENSNSHAEYFSRMQAYNNSTHYNSPLVSPAPPLDSASNMSSIAREANFKKLAKNTLKIAHDIERIIRCLRTSKHDYELCTWS